MEIYVVKSGDTLWLIAQKFGTDISQISLANELDNPNQLVIGQSLVIPEPGREYVVQNGDTLARIAAMFDVSITELAQANNISSGIIYIGEVLELPYFTHTVNPGETVWSISRRYGVSVDSILQANDMAEPGLIYPGQNLRIPAPERPVTEVNAYTTRFDDRSRRSVLALGRNFTYLAPFSYHVNADGSLEEIQETPVLDAAHQTNTAPLLVVTNFTEEEGFSSDLAASVLRNPDIQETLIDNLLAIMQEKGYAGVNFDFEYVYPEDRENYNNFLRRVVERLHPEFLVSTALAPKESAEQSGLLYEAHDYQTQGEIVDFIVSMTYEWGWAGGRPWAIAPINEVRDVLDFVVSVVPSEKVMMGVPLYGRDWKIPWVEGTTARTVSPQDAVQLAVQHGVPIEYNETYQAPFFHYTDETGQRHEVWFEDARSMQAKYDLIKEYNLRGPSYWVLGNAFPQNWAVLQDNFTVRKL
ncbi:LysM peptidoglycan-binding domain-containing protein [Virgibacillus siamensis]|uniref:LysM peptidoglycan-binding domain-containing protein n=1 Tax=Virgibacillus siamensis TaxID=480071 RepID=UPI0009843CCB|nr:LysM peptidoglycan-binding domain-containing protein [Virgibacillus siamensis]